MATGTDLFAFEGTDEFFEFFRAVAHFAQRFQFISEVPQISRFFSFLLNSFDRRDKILSLLLQRLKLSIDIEGFHSFVRSSCTCNFQSRRSGTCTRSTAKKRPSIDIIYSHMTIVAPQKC